MSGAANEEIARLEADAQQAWQTSITPPTGPSSCALALERANVESGEIRAELEAAQAAHRSDRQQLGRVDVLQNELAEAELRLAAGAESLIRGQHELDEQAGRFTSERDALQRQLSQMRNELEQTRAQAGQQGSQMTITMDQVRAATLAEQAKEWEGRCTNLEAEVVALRAQLAAACIDRDAANQMRDAAWHERDAANEQRDAAFRERNAVGQAPTPPARRGTW